MPLAAEVLRFLYLAWNTLLNNIVINHLLTLVGISQTEIISALLFPSSAVSTAVCVHLAVIVIILNTRLNFCGGLEFFGILV